MRRALLRNASLLFPVLIVVALGALATLGWQRSVVLQQSRDAVVAAMDQVRSLDLLAVRLRETEATYRVYLASGRDADLLAFQEAALHVTALAGRIEDAAAPDEASRQALFALIRLVDRHQDVLTREVALQRSGMPPAVKEGEGTSDADYVLGRVLTLEQRLESSHLAKRKKVSGGIRMLRWLAATVAILGIAGVLVVFRQLHRAWRKLSHAEIEQRLLASQLRGSLDSLSQGVAVFSADGLLLNWNTRLRHMLDLPPSLLKNGLSYKALETFVGAGGDRFLEPLSVISADAAARGEIPAVVYERRVCVNAGAGETNRPAEGGKPIEIRRTLMPQGGFVLTLTDMTDRTQAEQMLREAQKMQALGQLTGGIAHDFNNMLTVILGSLEVSPEALAAAGGDQVTLFATRMRRAAQAAESGAALTRQLLNFARKQPVTPAPADLGTLLPNLIPLLRHTIGDKIELSFRSADQLWPALVDAAMLESAVLNLALNARDAMPGGGAVAIEAANFSGDSRDGSAHADLPPGDYVRISVTDTGHGMSHEVIARAFEPFFTTKPDGRGTGLGLAMVSAFARQCGGVATIRSELGRGTGVTLYLPRSHSLARFEEAPQKLEPAAGPKPLPEVLRPRILVVEDDEAVREIAAETLREQGYRVSEAADAEDALRQIGSQSAALDLLLTDVSLPGEIDGRSLAARVRQNAPAMPVLFMSGHLESPLDAAGCGPAGCEDATRWLSKPFRRAQLTAAVGAMMSQPAGRAA